MRAGVYAVNGEKSPHATLHDLRRTFGRRMAERYPWPVLRLLMRHEDLKTTLDFYVGEDVESAKRLIWKPAIENARL
jgi:integrase